MGRLTAILVMMSLLLSLVVTPALAQAQSCQMSGQKTQQVLPGVTLTWDSSFHCWDVSSSGSHTFTVNISNAATNREPVSIDTLFLFHTTPRPRGRAPAATGAASGLPVVVAPGEARSFMVSGNYQLVSTDEGMKANLHFRGNGKGTTSGLPFRMGINVLLRSEGSVEDGNDAPPPWAGGPPPWAGGPPPWAGGPPPWAPRR
jgi:hypothetical protein